MSALRFKPLTLARRLALQRLADGWSFTLANIWVSPNDTVFNGLWETQLDCISSRVSCWLIQTQLVAFTGLLGYRITSRGQLALTNNTEQVANYRVVDAERVFDLRQKIARLEQELKDARAALHAAQAPVLNAGGSND